MKGVSFRHSTARNQKIKEESEMITKIAIVAVIAVAIIGVVAGISKNHNK